MTPVRPVLNSWLARSWNQESTIFSQFHPQTPRKKHLTFLTDLIWKVPPWLDNLFNAVIFPKVTLATLGFLSNLSLPTILWSLPVSVRSSFSLWCPVTSLLVGVEDVVEFFLDIRLTLLRCYHPDNHLSTFFAHSRHYHPDQYSPNHFLSTINLMSGSSTSVEHHKHHRHR